MSIQEYDLVIVGAGPAGMTCGIYGSRANLNTVIIEKLAPGGNVAITELVENYPGFEEGIMGAELASKFEAQALRFGTKFTSALVTGIELDGNYKIIHTDTGDFRTKVLVVASGTHHRFLEIPGEDRLFGRGVSNCATCDGPLYRGQNVAVVGGGDSAIQESLFLAKFVNKVTVIHRRDELRAQKILIDRAMAEKKIEFIWDSVVTEVIGEDGVDGVRIKNVKTNEEYVHNCAGFFVFIGMIPNTDFLCSQCDVDGGGFLITNENCETNIPGVYAVGDIRAKDLRQVVTAAGDGAVAAHDLEKYLY